MLTPAAMFAMIWIATNSPCILLLPCPLFILTCLCRSKHYMGVKCSGPSSESGVSCLGFSLSFLSNQIWCRLLCRSLLPWLNTGSDPLSVCVCVSLLLNVQLWWEVLRCSGCTFYLCSVLSPVCWWHPWVDLWDGSSTWCCLRVRSSRCGKKAWTKQKKKQKHVCGIVTLQATRSYSCHLRIIHHCSHFFPRHFSLLLLKSSLIPAWLHSRWW